MTRQTWDDEDDWNEEGEFRDDTFDQDSDDDAATIPCPYCGNEVHEDSPRCPSCENYLSLEEVQPRPIKKPWWVLLGAGLGLLVFLRWLFL